MSHDAVIIGSGAGGAAAAYELTRLGLSVLVLEAGPRFEPATDYPHDEAGWERRRFPRKAGSVAEIRYGDLGRTGPHDPALRSWNAVQGAPPSPDGRRQPGGGYSHVRGVGGSTLHFVGEAHRLHRDAFGLASALGAGADWPLSYEDLAPFYLQAERLIGVAGPERQTGRPRDASFPFAAHPLNPAARRLADAGTALNLPFEANSRAVLPVPRDGRPPCNYCGQCSRGCPIGDKGSADQTFLRHAARSGRMTLLAEAPVLRLHPGRDGSIAALDYRHRGRTHRRETPMLILAAGAVQTPRLLLHSACPGMPEGIANGSGEVGRNFMETLSWHGTGLVPGLRDSHKGLPADAVCWAQNGPDGVPGAAGGCRFTSSVQEIGFTGPIAYAQRLLPGFGAAFKDVMRARFGSALTVGATGAVIPDGRSRVRLDPDRHDPDGVPLPVIDSVLTENSLTLLAHMAGVGRRLLSECGVEPVAEQISSWDRFTATHAFGTARMGTDPSRSVTDARGRSHDHPNLWITDASVFPASGGGEAPALTIHALALRAAQHIVAG